MTRVTGGELRAQLAREGLPWTVNPTIGDGHLLPRHATGGNNAGLPAAASLPRLDVAALVAEHPTTNTLLRADLVARGVLAAEPGELAPLGAKPVIFLPHPATETFVAPPVITRPLPVAPLPPSGGGPAVSSSVDWRNRFGWSWITQIRDQDPCEHCWIYSAVALIEAMARIEHCVWTTRSEGDYIEANRVTCPATGNPEPVLNWAAANGIADLDCVPWVDSDPGDRSAPYWTATPAPAPPGWAPSSNRSGRTVRIPAFQTIGNVADQKAWIDNIGPLVTWFEVYDDFFGWSGSQPYVRSSSASDQGGHFMLVVGYDDSLGCWIVKNSWGPGWGDGGFGLIAYGQSQIDQYAKYGLQLTNPDPWTKRRSHSGGMIESGDGALHRNFELIAPSGGGTVTHWWRDNSSASLPWAKAEVLGSDASVHAPTLTGTTYNRNFEFVYPTTSGQIRHWWFDQSAQTWNQGEVFSSGVDAPVGFVESTYGPGNFEVVHCTPSGQLQHWWRDPSFQWHQGTAFGSGVATMGPSLVQSTWGNLELVTVLESGQLQHWWRNDGGDMAWTGDAVFGSGVSSPPCMIQGQYGMADEHGNGNFELCVAMPDGTVQHWWRNNQDTAHFPWAQSATFGSGVSSVVSLVEGSFGFNLELIVIRTDGNLQHYWRDSAGWHAGVIIGPA